MKIKLWAFSILLAIGLWSQNVYVEYCPDMSSFTAKSDDWYAIGECVFVKAFPMEIAKKVVDKRTLWDLGSKFFLFVAALLGLWIAIDVIDPVLERIRKEK
jgi:hypothetical protein